MPDDDRRHVPLSYRGPTAPLPRSARPPDPVWVSLFCLPGLFCWVVLLSFLLGTIFRFSIPTWIARYIYLWLWVAWPVAILTALTSLILYAFRRPKPWYVWLNLVINGAGLLFTLAVLLIVLAHR